MNYPLYILFGLAPCIIWLLFYLRKDAHPEPKRMVIKVFFYGMLVAIPAVFLEMGFFEIVPKFAEKLGSSWIVILNVFVGIALTEEVLKYLVVKRGVLRNPEFDEPVDAVLYMIIAALGFAALENILILFSLGPGLLIKEALEISAFTSFLRFLGAIFLHTLCSGILGYFLALSFFEAKKRLKLLITGLAIATFLHGLFNYSIMKIEETIMVVNDLIIFTSLPLFIFWFSVLITILVGLAIFLFSGFKKLKKLKSICLPDLPKAGR